jgi:uncharacterized protein (DUF983 family)
MPASTSPDPQAERPLRPALARGWRRRCPNCGEGRLLRGYLAVAPNCDACGEDFTPQRADDGPAYLTILIVGHLMAPVLHLAYTRYTPDPLTLALILGAGVTALSLWLLPRIKGAFVALQWAKRMHGFGGPEAEPAHDHV